jgi:parallel beta-helix repeat protein
MESERRKIGKALVFAVLFVTLAFLSIGCASAATHYVNPGESIQAAIDNATIGDTIIVRDGTYNENVDVNKRLTIRSENGSDFTIVQAANSNDHLFEVTVDYVNISGFTVDGAKGAEWSKSGIYLEANYSIIANNNCSNTTGGIRLQRSNTNTIENNICSHNSIGIRLEESNSNTITNNVCFLNGRGIRLEESNSNTIANNDCSNNAFGGIALENSNSNTITNNICSSNAKQLFKEGGIHLDRSNSNTITDNICSSNGFDGIELDVSNNNIIANNNCSNNHGNGIYFRYSNSNNNTIVNNICSSNHYDGIALWHYHYNNTIVNNVCFSNTYYGIEIVYSDNNTIYFNNFMNNTGNVRSHNSTNIWNSTEKITYTYKGKTYTNYLGSYWDDYEEKYPDAEEIDGSGIWNTPYSIDSDNDNYPLMDPWENYFKLLEGGIFDTEPSENPYPSIMGTHKGTIEPSHDIVVNKMYTYPCVGTGGHSEYVEISNESGIVATGYWKGYRDDYHNISFPQQFTLLANHRYNYTIITGSYPQIIHEHVFNTISDGEITCIEFIDANGKSYDNWIPAIRLE